MQKIDPYTFIISRIINYRYLCMIVHVPGKRFDPVNSYTGKIIVINHIKPVARVAVLNFKTDLIFFNMFIEFFKVEGLTVRNINE